MSFSVGIVGLPNVGKSTLFKILTKREVKISPRPFTTIEPNIGQIPLPDERLEKISSLIKPEKTTPATIEFVDIAGLVKGAHKGEGLGNQFLSYVRNVELILIVVRAFEDLSVENVLGKINPKEEIDCLKTELLMKDLETIERILSKEEKRKDFKKVELLRKLKENVERGILISEVEFSESEKELTKEFQFLTEKPIFFLINFDGKTKFEMPREDFLKINLKEEEELFSFSEEEKAELGIKSQIDQLIKNCYKKLNLITFYTIAGGKEVRAWTIKKDSPIQKAGGLIHSDFEKKFIKAEVINWRELIEIGSWTGAKEKGLIKTVGKDYQIKDGEIIEIKI